ncbi:MAG: SRPBCC family protein [Granulosicoccaceae bacterium]
MSNSVISKTVFFNVSRDTLWQYLTEKEKLGLWFHPAQADLEEGQPYALVSADSGEKLCWGEVLSMLPPESMRWSFTVGPLGGAMTMVHWQLEKSHGGTRLTLTHEGIGDAAGDAALGLLMALDAGWDEHFAALRTAVTDTCGDVNGGHGCD